jgi:hypothetical protein
MASQQSELAEQLSSSATAKVVYNPTWPTGVDHHRSDRRLGAAGGLVLSVSSCAQIIRVWRACRSGGRRFQAEPFLDLF